MTVRSHRFEIAFGIVSLIVCALVWLWQFPGFLGSRLTAAEVDRYLATIDAQVPMPASEKVPSLVRLRAWAMADDGRPVYMLNLMRFYPEFRRIPGARFSGTPAEANARYERAVTPLLLKVGGMGQFAGTPQGRNVLDSPPDVDNWTRVLLVRYPSRRAFLELLADPGYGPSAPLKLMASQVYLVPLSADLILPETRWAVAVLLLAGFLTTGWIRAARRAAVSGGGSISAAGRFN